MKQPADDMMTETTAQNRVNLHGVLLPTDWDAEGNVVRMAVFTMDEEEYAVVSEGEPNLLEYLREEVVVRGILQKGKVVCVSHVSLVT